MYRHTVLHGKGGHEAVRNAAGRWQDRRTQDSEASPQNTRQILLLKRVLRAQHARRARGASTRRACRRRQKRPYLLLYVGGHVGT